MKISSRIVERIVPLTFLLATFCWAKRPASQLPDGVALDGPASIALGEVPCFETRHTPFRLKNTGSEPVPIVGLHPTCKCVKGQASSDTIPPGGETVVTLALNAASVHGTFERGLWVNFQNGRRAFLTVTGNVVPLFTGVPEKATLLKAPDMNVVWTNRLLITSPYANAGLGQAEVLTDPGVSATYSLDTTTHVDVVTGSTNRLCTITTLIKPLALGRSRAAFFFPVEGYPNQSPVRVSFATRAGSVLSCNPDELAFYGATIAIRRRLLINTDDAEADPKALTWEPVIDGMDITVAPSRNTSNLLLSIFCSIEAQKKVIAAKEMQLRFTYPKHGSVAVRLFAVTDDADDDDEDEGEEAPAL